MYRRAVLTLYRVGRERTAGAPSAIRYTDHILRCFSFGHVQYSDSKPPEDHADSNPPAEENKNAPLKKNSSQPLQKNNLLNFLRGMKVKVSAEKRFQKHRGFQNASKMFQMASEGKQPEEEKTVSPEMVAAVSAVASTFPMKKKKVESELLQQLRLQKQMAKNQSKGDLNVGNVISEMKIKQKPKSLQRFQEIESDFIKSSRKLFTGKRLQIFPIRLVSEPTTITESSPTLWDIELAKQIATACEQPSRNSFEEMIQWTNEGKMWTFPIDNEVGLDEEQNVEFHEHIFLDTYLEDFPKQGPIRHFMELVVCGLSKNAYLTVQQKKEHFDWFRDYFNQKEDLLRQLEL